MDLSLVSAAFVLEQPGSFRILPDFSVSVLGRVYSVNLFHTRPLAELRRVALTTESRTSVVLLRRLLELRGVFPEFVTTTGGLELLEKFDALLLIGDRAIQAYAQGFSGPVPPVRNWPERVGSIQVTDLAQLWWEQTGLPFVFAVWASRQRLKFWRLCGQRARPELLLWAGWPSMKPPGSGCLTRLCCITCGISAITWKLPTGPVWPSSLRS